MRTTTTITATIALTSVLALTLGACGAREPIRAEPGKPSASAESPATVIEPGEPGSDGLDFCSEIGPDDFDGDETLLAAVGGREGMYAAHCHVVNFLGWAAYTESLAVPGAVEDPAMVVEAVRPWLTKDALTTVRSLTEAALAGDEDAHRDLIALTVVEVDYSEQGYRLRAEAEPDGAPLVGQRSWGEAEMTLTADGDLEVTIPYTADILLERDSAPYVSRWEMTRVFTLVPTGMEDRPWLIDGWRTTYDKVADPVAEADLPPIIPADPEAQ